MLFGIITLYNCLISQSKCCIDQFSINYYINLAVIAGYLLWYERIQDVLFLKNSFPTFHILQTDFRTDSTDCSSMYSNMLAIY